MVFLEVETSLRANWPPLSFPQKSQLKLLPHQAEQEDSTKFVVLTFLSVACIVGVLLTSGLIYCIRHSSHYKLREKLSGLGGHPGTDATAAYQVKGPSAFPSAVLELFPPPSLALAHLFIVWILL